MEQRITSEYFPQNAIKTAEGKQQRTTIITNTVIQRQLVTLALQFYYKMKTLKIENGGSSVTNGLTLALSRPLLKLVFVHCSIKSKYDNEKQKKIKRIRRGASTQ